MGADLEREFSRAIRFAKAASSKLGDFGFSHRTQWGFGRVEWWGTDRRYYEPYDDGQTLAVIAPVVEGGELIDLAAIDPFSQHVGQRIGLGHALGLDAVEKARMRCCCLQLVERPLEWLRSSPSINVEFQQPDEAVYLLRLADVEAVLRDVPQILCTTVEFAERVQSLLPPSQRDRVVLP